MTPLSSSRITKALGAKRVVNLGPPYIDAIADAVIHSICVTETKAALRQAVAADGKKPIRISHAAYFDALFKRLGPYDRRWKAMLRALWADEKAVILANLKKLKKGYRPSRKPAQMVYPGIVATSIIPKISGEIANLSRKELIQLVDTSEAFGYWKGVSDNILYPQGPFKARLSRETQKLLAAMMSDLGQDKLDELDLNIVFDVTSPHVKQWIADYTFKFSENLEAVNIEKLRGILDSGLEAGKTIPELMAEVKTCFDSWDVYRAEIISRTESSRASNQSAIEAYRQSGVVKEKQWLTAPDCCDVCAEMDGDTVGIDETFFDDDYSDGMAPPKHPNCRCSVVAFFE